MALERSILCAEALKWCSGCQLTPRSPHWQHPGSYSGDRLCLRAPYKPHIPSRRATNKQALETSHNIISIASHTPDKHLNVPSITARDRSNDQSTLQTRAQPASCSQISRRLAPHLELTPCILRRSNTPTSGRSVPTINKAGPLKRPSGHSDLSHPSPHLLHSLFCARSQRLETPGRYRAGRDRGPQHVRPPGRTAASQDQRRN